VGERCVLDTGDEGDRRSDGLLDVAMERTSVVTRRTVDTAGATVFEPMEKNNKRKWRWRSNAAATPSVWRSRMERTMRPHAQELMQLHKSVKHVTNLEQAQAACEEAKWLGKRTWI
jgi:hypothetical protein